MDSRDEVATNNRATAGIDEASGGHAERFLPVADEDIDLGCGGCTHWLTLDPDSPDLPK